jgi:Txe/YoeB family toxin of Txe-Axe toxin-antitoxin module
LDVIHSHGTSLFIIRGNITFKFISWVGRINNNHRVAYDIRKRRVYCKRHTTGHCGSYCHSRCCLRIISIAIHTGTSCRSSWSSRSRGTINTIKIHIIHNSFRWTECSTEILDVIHGCCAGLFIVRGNITFEFIGWVGRINNNHRVTYDIRKRRIYCERHTAF